MSFKDRLYFDPTVLAEAYKGGGLVGGSYETMNPHTTAGGKEALDVFIAGSSGLGVYAEDSASVSGDLGQFILVVRKDAVGSLVSADGDYSALQVDANGRLRVDAEVSVSTGSDKVEDTASSTGDTGTFTLGVRQDTLSSLVDTDGDYAAFKLDALGRMWTHAMAEGLVADSAADANNPLKIGFRAIAGALVSTGMADNDRADGISDLYRRQYVNTAPNIDGSSEAIAVDDTAGGTVLFATPLAGRRTVSIQNLGAKDMYIGFGTLTAAAGTRVAKGVTIERELGPDIVLKGIAQTGETNDVRVMQLA
jgi:hypothetical protein